MKKIFIAGLFLLFVFQNNLFAQQPAMDSAAQAKRLARITKLTSEIASQKEELAKVEASLVNAQQNNSSASERANEAASDNARVAERLQNDPTDKRLSRKARKSAKAAKRDARRGRKAESSMDSYTNRAEKLRKSIAADEQKLAELNATPGS